MEDPSGSSGPPERRLGGSRPHGPELDWVLYVDLDAYYVACELRDRPELLGRPVIVGPPPSDGPTRGVVLSASYEARAFGVRSALPAATAARLCPDAVWIPPDFAKYERLAGEVRRLLRERVERVIPYSIDECALLPERCSADDAVLLARSLQRRLKEELRLGASVGVSTSRVVAKVASDRAKPGGVLLVRPEEIASFLAPLPVRAVPGVGPKTESVLAGHGVRTVGDLAGRKASDLVRDLGGFARELVALARGSPLEETEGLPGRRSRSADHTFARDAGTFEAIEPVVRELASGLADTLGSERLRFGAVAVAFRWSNFERSQRGRTLPASQEGAAGLLEAAVHLARGLWASEQAGKGRAVRTVSVRAERLTDLAQRQVSLDTFARRPSSGGRP